MLVPIEEYSRWFWKQSISGKQFLKVISWFHNKAFVELLRVFVVSFVFSGVSFAVYGILNLKSKSSDGHKGLQDKDSVNKMLKSQGSKNGVRIGDVKLPRGIERKHLLVTGTTGAGKTNFLKFLCLDIRNRKEKAVIFDIAGEFRKNFFREGIDIVINPFDKTLDHIWDPWNEFTEEGKDLEIKNLLNALLPPNPKKQDFFEDTAKRLLTEVFKGSKSFEEVFLVFKEGTESLRRRFSDSELSFFVGESSSKETTGSIIATAVHAILRLECLIESQEKSSKAQASNEQNEKNRFSIKKWLEKDDDSWLFFSVNAPERSSLKHLLCVWADMCVRNLMGKNPDESVQNTWIILDELSAFEYIPSLATGLAELRKYGGCIVGATQNIAQLRAIYEYHDAQALIDLFSNKFVFRSGEFEIAEYFSKFFGEEKTIEKKESITFGNDSRRDSVHIGEQEKKESIVSSSDILNLPDLECFMKLAIGGVPVSKIKFEIFKK